MKWTRFALAIAIVRSRVVGNRLRRVGRRKAGCTADGPIHSRDRSLGESLGRGAARFEAALDDLVESRLHNGDELVLLEMYGSSDTGDHQWIDSVPRARTPGVVSTADKRRLDDFKAVAHQVVGAMFDPNRVRRIDNTDVFATISRAADYAKGAHDRRSTLILLSDMENSTDEIRMERSGVPSSQWIEVRRRANRLPDMRGVCVLVAGAASTTQREATIRDFWVRYLAAAGTTLAATNYRAFVPDAMELRC